MTDFPGDVSALRIIHGVDEREISRNADGDVVCEFCGSIMEPYSPELGVTWYSCEECGAQVVGVGEFGCLAGAE